MADTRSPDVANGRIRRLTRPLPHCITVCFLRDVDTIKSIPLHDAGCARDPDNSIPIT